MKFHYILTVLERFSQVQCFVLLRHCAGGRFGAKNKVERKTVIVEVQIGILK